MKVAFVEYADTGVIKMDDGQLAILQGVGYPNPNRSHFRSTEIWQTGSDADQVLSSGWIGRYFDHQCKGEDPSVGISLGKTPPQSFTGPSPMGITFEDPRRFRYSGADADEAMMKQDIDSLSSSEGDSMAMASGGSVQLPANANPLDFLERVALDARVSSGQIQEVIKKPYQGGEYPRSRLAEDFQTVAQLIAGGMPTRIYYLNFGGFDTHTNQEGSHNRLSSEWSDALHAFIQDMKRQGNNQRVTVMVFSEFGRRVKENASGGTDHGAAAPLFIAGGGIKAGVHGAHPSLNSRDLDKGDLQHHVDFRSVYSTLIRDILKADPVEILGKAYPNLSLFG